MARAGPGTRETARVVAVVAMACLPALAGLAAAQAYPDPAKAPRFSDSGCVVEYDKRFVFDYLQVVPPDLAHEMEGAACDVYAETSAHFVLVTVNNTGGETIESYALHLFERWGIGDKARHDGLLLLYAAHEGGPDDPPAVRVEVGYGLEAVVNGPVSGDAVRIMQDAKARALDAGRDPDWATGFALSSGALFLLTAVRDGYTEAGFPQPNRGPEVWFWVVVVVAFVLLAAALARSAQHRGGRQGWGYAAGSSSWGSGYASTWVGGSQVLRDTMHGGGSFGGGMSGGGGRSGKL